MWVITEAHTGNEVDSFENYRDALRFRDDHNANHSELVGPYNMRWEEER